MTVATSYEQTLKQNYALVRQRLGNGPVSLKDSQASIRDIEFRKQVARRERELIDLLTNAEAKVASLTAEKEALILQRSDWQSVILYLTSKVNELEQEQVDWQKPELRIPTRDIICEVLKDFPEVSFADVISHRRGRALIAARHSCIHAVYCQRPDLSLPQIGKIFERDHTTILHAVRKMQAAANDQSVEA